MGLGLQVRKEGLESVSCGKACAEERRECIVFGREFLQSFDVSANESCEAGIEGSLYVCQKARSPYELNAPHGIHEDIIRVRSLEEGDNLSSINPYNSRKAASTAPLANPSTQQEHCIDTAPPPQQTKGASPP